MGTLSFERSKAVMRHFVWFFNLAYIRSIMNTGYYPHFDITALE